MSNITTTPSESNFMIGQGLYQAMFKRLDEYAVGDLFSRQTMCELAAELAIDAVDLMFKPASTDLAIKAFGSQPAVNAIVALAEQSRLEIIQVIHGQNVYAVFPNGPRG